MHGRAQHMIPTLTGVVHTYIFACMNVTKAIPRTCLYIRTYVHNYPTRYNAQTHDLHKSEINE